MNVLEFLEEANRKADPSSCMEHYLVGCSLQASLGERLSKAEQSVAVLEASFGSKETAAKAQVLARGTQEYYDYRVIKYQFAALDNALIGLRHKAHALAAEFKNIVMEPKI